MSNAPTYEGAENSLGEKRTFALSHPTLLVPLLLQKLIFDSLVRIRAEHIRSSETAWLKMKLPSNPKQIHA